MDELGFVVLCQAFLRLDLDDDFIVYQEISFIFTGNKPFINHIDFNLLVVFDVSQVKFMGKRTLINRLQKSISQDLMHFHRRPNNRICLLLIKIPSILAHDYSSIT
jgi:hypothetical protein